MSDALEQSLDPGLTEWERSREREEFVRASILYRPSSSSLSSRFTRAKDQEDEDSVEVNRDEEVGAHSVCDDLMYSQQPLFQWFITSVDT